MLYGLLVLIGKARLNVILPADFNFSIPGLLISFCIHLLENKNYALGSIKAKFLHSEVCNSEREEAVLRSY